MNDPTKRHVDRAGTDDPARTYQMNSQIDCLCDEFEAGLRQGKKPSIASRLKEVSGEALEGLLERLLLIKFSIDVQFGRSSNLREIHRELPGKAELILEQFDKAQDGRFASEGFAETVGTLSTESPTVAAAEAIVESRYDIEQEIARGGMGVVYKARHRRLDMPAAIKMMLPGSSSERFLIEARLLAAVNSPHVVRIYDFDVLSDDRQVICMEWVDGSDLARRITAAENNRIPEHQVIEWMKQTAAGMAQAARNGITHRDLKPSNILIDQTSKVRVADFGLASSPNEQLGKTGSNQILGTPYYMSPEQAESPKSVDTRSDIYSFGATFYHALTGQVPFDGDTLFRILFNHKTETLLTPKSVVSELSDGVSQLLDKCMAKSPSERFQSFDELEVHLGQLTKLGFHWTEMHDSWLGAHIDTFKARKTKYLNQGFDGDEYRFAEGRVLRLVDGDIADQDVAAVVSTDDYNLSMTGGVSSAIAEKAGQAYVLEAREFAPVQPGRTVVTRSGNLPCRFVFHAITLKHKPENLQFPSRDIITELINGSFYHADSLGLRSIAFPLIGTGIAGFSHEVILDLMFRLVARKLLHGVTCVQEVRIVRVDEEQAAVAWYERLKKRREEPNSTIMLLTEGAIEDEGNDCEA